MPWLLYRYILLDLVRIIALTTMVLVTVIAFGATLKPLAGDSLLEPMQVLKYLGLAIVPMLQFALPFAAGFGATLCLHRMTTDNEIQAMSASGISYRRILAPILVFGIVLMLFMVVITQWVIPRFWSAIEQLVSMDVTKMFQASIKRGEPFKLPGDIQIYAEEIYSTENPEGPDGPQTRMMLTRVAAAKLADGRDVTDVTGNHAVVDVYHREGKTYLKFVMKDAMAFNAETGDLYYSDRVVPTKPLVMPSVLPDNPKALTRTQLLALRENPDDFSKVMLAKDDLADAMRDAEARGSIDLQLRDNHRVVLVADRADETSPAFSYIISADRLHEGQFATKDDSPIDILQREGDRAVRRFVSNRVELIPSAGLETSSRFDLVIGQHQVIDMRPGGATNERAQLTIPNLFVADLAGEDFSGWSSRQLLQKAESMRSGPEQVRPKLKALVRQIDSLNREISSRLLARYALSATAFLLLVLGSVLAMWQRRSLPLTVYTWAFLPAVIDLILISAGEQVLRDGRTLGHFTMWSGNVIMCAGLLIAYRKLSRH